MSSKLKVRLTILAGVIVGAVLMFVFLAGNDAQAPPPEFARLVDVVVYVDNNETPCPVPPPSRECRRVRKAGR